MFRQYGASSAIRRDQNPRFMSDVFWHFRYMTESQQQATLAYPPQINGQQERRSSRAYVEDPGHGDLDHIAEKVMFAMKISCDFTRKETSFYLVHGWDTETTLLAMLGKPMAQSKQRVSRIWSVKAQRLFEYANQAKNERAEAQTKRCHGMSGKVKHGFGIGDAVWMYMARAKPGLSKKLAHVWHGPFRVVEKDEDIRCKLMIPNSSYCFCRWVHPSQLKPRYMSPNRQAQSPSPVDPGSDFDAALLPDNS
ncbi:hypothetical protein PybrP1_008408 [[Pythium] brassicae (nom. inval.)]|nr:hypothetical protein PybrP1_008408 [[Pythium] brassicae (nom. inval.)]